MFLAPPYYSQRAVFASPRSAFFIVHVATPRRMQTGRFYLQSIAFATSRRRICRHPSSWCIPRSITGVAHLMLVFSATIDPSAINYKKYGRIFPPNSFHFGCMGPKETDTRTCGQREKETDGDIEGRTTSFRNMPLRGRVL